MKRKHIAIALVCMALASAGAAAQTADWHIDLAAAGNMLQGEDDALLGLRLQRYTVTPALTAGRWISPSLGIQASFWGGKLNGLGLGRTPYATVLNPDIVLVNNRKFPEPWEEHINFCMAQLEGTFNFNNCLCGVSEERNWWMIAHAGLNYAYSFGNGNHCGSVGAVAGLTSNWKLAGRLNIFIDYTFTLLGKNFDLVTYRGNVDDMMSLRVGLSLNIGKKLADRQKRVTVDNYTKARQADQQNHDKRSR